MFRNPPRGVGTGPDHPDRKCCLPRAGGRRPARKNRPAFLAWAVTWLSRRRSVGVRLVFEFFLQSLDFLPEILNRGILLLQLLDSLVEGTVLLKQGFRVGFLLRVHLLGVRLGVTGWRWLGFRDDGAKWQRVGIRWPVIPFGGLFATVERMALVHRVREIRIGVSAHRIRPYDFGRAHFGRFERRKQRRAFRD